MNVTSLMRKASVGTAGGLLIASSLLAVQAAPAAASPAPEPTPTQAPVFGPLPAPPPERPDCDEVKCVALTFDDGPGEHTADLLDTLDEHDAKATFYVLGSKVDAHEEEVKRMARQGHEVGNHTWDHDDLTTLSGKEIEKDLERTDEAISAVTGEDPATMRPPYGALNDTARDAIDHPILLWDVDTLDWQNRDSDKILDITLEETSEGSVVLFHDIHKSSVDAIPEVLEELGDEDYEFVTVSEMFDDELESGQAYNARSQ